MMVSSPMRSVHRVKALEVPSTDQLDLPTMLMGRNKG